MRRTLTTKVRTKGRPKNVPNKFMCELCLNFCLLGATNEKLAKIFRVPLGTIKEWIASDENFSAAVREGRDESVAKVGRSVYDRARGFGYIEKTYARRVVRGANGNPVLDSNGHQRSELVLITEHHKHQVPDIAAAKFYMWNRTKMLPKDEKWHDNQQIDHTSSDGTMSPKEIISANMDPKEASRLYQQMIKDGKK